MPSLTLSTFILFVILGVMLGYNSTYGQNTSSTSWLTHTSTNCHLTIDYPSTWTIEEKKDRFDTITPLLKLQSNNTTPYIIFTECQKFDSPADMEPLNVYVNTLLIKMITGDDPYKIVDYSHVGKG
jgi:hypothetical protein